MPGSSESVSSTAPPEGNAPPSTAVPDSSQKKTTPSLAAEPVVNPSPKAKTTAGLQAPTPKKAPQQHQPMPSPQKSKENGPLDPWDHIKKCSRGEFGLEDLIATAKAKYGLLTLPVLLTAPVTLPVALLGYGIYKGITALKERSQSSSNNESPEKTSDTKTEDTSKGSPNKNKSGVQTTTDTTATATSAPASEPSSQEAVVQSSQSHTNEEEEEFFDTLEEQEPPADLTSALNGSPLVAEAESADDNSSINSHRA